MIEDVMSMKSVWRGLELLYNSTWRVQNGGFRIWNIGNLFLILQSDKGPDGGIGRRAGLKHQWSNPCRFDPGSGYRNGGVEHSAPPKIL